MDAELVERRAARPAPAAVDGRSDGGGHERLSTYLVVAAVALNGVPLVLLPLVLLPTHPAWGWLLVPLALFTTPFWSLIHEAIHGTLLANRARNDRYGRTLAVLYGAPFALLKTGHLLHHRYSRTVRERTEIYDARTTTWARVAPGYYVRLLGGLYVAEIASVAMALLPAAVLRRIARRLDAEDSVAGMLVERVAGPRTLGQFRLDAAAVVVVYAAAFVAYGPYWWMLLAALGGRALLVSISDNAYHYDTELDASLVALNLRLPPALEAFALAFNLHSVHHRHPGLHWYELRRAFLAEGDRYHAGWFSAVVRQLRGPIKLP